MRFEDFEECFAHAVGGGTDACAGRVFEVTATCLAGDYTDRHRCSGSRRRGGRNLRDRISRTDVEDDLLGGANNAVADDERDVVWAGLRRRLPNNIALRVGLAGTGLDLPRRA